EHGDPLDRAIALGHWRGGRGDPADGGDDIRRPPDRRRGHRRFPTRPLFRRPEASLAPASRTEVVLAGTGQARSYSHHNLMKDTRARPVQWAAGARLGAFRPNTLPKMGGFINLNFWPVSIIYLPRCI